MTTTTNATAEVNMESLSDVELIRSALDYARNNATFPNDGNTKLGVIITALDEVGGA